MGGFPGFSIMLKATGYFTQNVHGILVLFYSYCRLKIKKNLICNVLNAPIEVIHFGGISNFNIQD